MDYKISFCITCMNRLSHIQETLPRNIKDNYCLGEVEFVLLDYNSSDGLEDWVKSNMENHIKTGILAYYKTLDPQTYLRSHSRNIAFKLANGQIVCNLDADNFLGKDFAADMISRFSISESIFYTSDLTSPDVYGRVLLLKKDFLDVNGYDESLVGYGFEDLDLFHRLKRKGLTQHYFFNRDYYRAIMHPIEDRVSQEAISTNIDKMYLSYNNPNETEVLLFNKDKTYEHGILLDNRYSVFTESLNETDTIKESNRVLLKNYIETGLWNMKSDDIIFNFKSNHHNVMYDSSQFNIGENLFFKVDDLELKNTVILFLSMAMNEKKFVESINQNHLVNQYGFGKDIVYKNFNYKDKIELS